MYAAIYLLYLFFMEIKYFWASNTLNKMIRIILIRFSNIHLVVCLNSVRGCFDQTGNAVAMNQIVPSWRLKKFLKDSLERFQTTRALIEKLMEHRSTTRTIRYALNASVQKHNREDRPPRSADAFEIEIQRCCKASVVSPRRLTWGEPLRSVSDLSNKQTAVSVAGDYLLWRDWSDNWGMISLFLSESFAWNSHWELFCPLNANNLSLSCEFFSFVTFISTLYCFYNWINRLLFSLREIKWEESMLKWNISLHTLR